MFNKCKHRIHLFRMEGILHLARAAILLAALEFLVVSGTIACFCRVELACKVSWLIGKGQNLTFKAKRCLIFPWPLQAGSTVFS